jgi:predicted nucleotidyltransferase
MDDGLPTGWRERVAGWAAGKERIREVHFFGSRAKGEHHDESDVDLAYLLTGDEPGERLAYSICECGGWQAELAALLGVRMDLQFTDNVDDLAVWTWVREHGELIYRKPGCQPVK